MLCPSCGHENLEGSDRCENCLASFRDLDVPRADSAEGLARSVMEDNLGRLEQEQTVIVGPDTPAIEVARLMKNSNSGCALIVDGKKLVGIFTEHDVLLRMTAGTGSATAGSATAGSAATGRAAAGSAGILPANEREARTGSDEPHTDINVQDLPVNEMPFSETPFEEMRAEEMMFEETSTSSELEGGDNAKRANNQLQIPVRNLMSPNPETLHEKDSVAEAVNKMSLGRYRHIPFLKSDGTYAVASIKSVLKYISQEDW